MMNLEKTLLVREFLAGLQSFVRNPLLVLSASFFDALFIFLYAFIVTLIGDQIAAYVVLISNQISPMIAAGQTGILFKLFEGALKSLSLKLVGLIFLFFISLYFLYILLQGASWFISSKIAGVKTVSQVSYFLKFAKLNLAWLVFFAVWKFLDLFFSVRYQLLKKFAPGTDFAAIIFTALFVVLAISAFLSYARLRFSEIFRLPLKVSFGIIGVCLVFALVSMFVVSQLGRLNVDLGLFFSILLFPVFVLMRIYAIKVINNVRS